ncbi:MAG: FtsX-like permease family protein [Bacteroidales bacterium]|nr:FtsX-like permease family protein [Bacteroidales bacterium]
MGTDVVKGTVHTGSLLSRNIPENTPFTITGKDGMQYSFEVAKRLGEGRGMLDQGVAFNLHDLQTILDMEGKINRIEALGCICHDGRIKNARKQVQELFSDLEVAEISNIADARENQRLMMNKYGSFIIPFIILTCLLITSLLFFQNVTVRNREIGLLKAMGRGNATILFLFLAKAFILGLAGGVVGFFIGTWIARYFGKEIFLFTFNAIKPIWSLFIVTLIIFPVLWMLASWIPALRATQIDAARTLSEE